VSEIEFAYAVLNFRHLAMVSPFDFVDIVLFLCSYFFHCFVLLSSEFFGQSSRFFFESPRDVCLDQLVPALIALPVLAFLLRFLGVGNPTAWRND